MKFSKCKKIIEEDKKLISRSLTRSYNFVFSHAKGFYCYDVDNNKYLDFATGITVNALGNLHKAIVNAIKEQLKRGIHAAFSDFYAEEPIRFVKALKQFLPKKLNNFFLCNSGTEAVEAAYKVAKWHTRKKYMVAFKGAFHGRTMASLSLTYSKKVHKEGFEPFLPVKHLPFSYCFRCPFNKKRESCSLECLEEFEKFIKKNYENIAAVFVEPVQGEGGYIPADKEFLRGIYKLCKEYNVLLAVDEIQCGCFRTAKFLASEHYKIKPDILCLAKPIGGGLPLGVMVTNKKIADWPYAAHANTFGGNLLACAAGNAFLKYCKKVKIWKNVSKQGKLLFKLLNEETQKWDLITDVRGKGLMIGLELAYKNKKYATKERDEIIKNAFFRGLLLLPCGFSAIRFCPPLNINAKLISKAIRILNLSHKNIAQI